MAHHECKCQQWARYAIVCMCQKFARFHLRGNVEAFLKWTHNLRRLLPASQARALISGMCSRFSRNGCRICYPMLLSEICASERRRKISHQPFSSFVKQVWNNCEYMPPFLRSRKCAYTPKSFEPQKPAIHGYASKT